MKPPSQFADYAQRSMQTQISNSVLQGCSQHERKAEAECRELVFKRDRKESKGVSISASRPSRPVALTEGEGSHVTVLFPHEALLGFGSGPD